jgi:hypothetical protein
LRNHRAQRATDTDGYAPNAFIDIGGDGQIKIVAMARAKDRNTPPAHRHRLKSVSLRDSSTPKPPDHIFTPYSQRR